MCTYSLKQGTELTCSTLAQIAVKNSRHKSNWGYRLLQENFKLQTANSKISSRGDHAEAVRGEFPHNPLDPS
jgi:hypothetical protein